MTGKVKCTCGWSWNKSDSSKKDMYVCHECGRDNSNNMKNGGWLDSYADGGTMQEHQENYNDSSVSLPEGFVGEGYNTKGRNYSPAWGGQFEDGGLIPIAQNGRATAADSLDIYNRSLKIDAYYNNLKKKGWYPKKEIFPTRGLTSKDLEKEMKEIDKESRETYKKQSQESKEYSRLKNMYPNADPKKANLDALAEHKKLTKGTRYASKDNLPSIIDPMAPTTVIDTRIIPKERVHYETIVGFKNDEFYKKYPNPTKAQEEKFYKEIGKLGNAEPPSGTAVNLYRYDPLSVKPWNMLTDAEKKLRVQKYGTDGVPKSYIKGIKDKLNKDPEIKPTGAPIYNKVEKRYEWEGTLNPLPKQQKVEAINLPPMQNQSVSFPNQEIDVRTPAQAPTSFDISSQRYNMEGPSDYYNYNEEGVDYETALRLQQVAEKYNADIEKRYGPQNEYRTEKSKQEAARRLEQLRQDVKVRPNYQMGGSVYPVNYVPQAQEGEKIENRIDNFLGNPQEKARSKSRIFFDEEPIDNLRHSFAGRYTQDAISKKLGNGIVGNAVGLIGSNTMGAAHELSGLFKDKRDWSTKLRESGEDMFNNAFGSIVGALPYMDSKAKDELMFKMAKGNLLPDGYVSTPKGIKKGLSKNVYFKNEKGKIERKYAMGGSIPGAVGFSYARTQSPAPSNGKYAKKTMPSAQGGLTVRESTSVGKDRIPISYKNIIKKGSIKNSGYNYKGKLVLKDSDGAYKPYTPPEVAEVRKYVPQSKVSKAKEIALNPMTAAGYITRNENIPDNFSRSEDTRNILDTAIDFINPAYYVDSAKNLVQGQGQVFSDLSEGNFGDAALNQTMAGVEALNFIPLGKGAKPLLNKAGKALGTESGLLSNAWRLNPKAYQYNLPENTMWRGLGKEGMKDAVSSGLFRSKQDVVPEFYPGTKLRMDKSFGTNPYFTPKFKTASTYGDQFLAEVPRDAANWRNRYKRTTWSQVADKPIPVDEGRILQKNWLQGYKEIPKQEDGGVIKDDRGQWDHPGEITEINSNEITMGPDPITGKKLTRPLIGVSDTGDVKIMKPGKNYKFKGTKVTEYPMAKNGIRQEQKGLQNLNNLVNFTNYNTKQPGGWLDKY